jgi:hypothetical protein
MEVIAAASTLSRIPAARRGRRRRRPETMFFLSLSQMA